MSSAIENLDILGGFFLYHTSEFNDICVLLVGLNFMSFAVENLDILGGFFLYHRIRI